MEEKKKNNHKKSNATMVDSSWDGNDSANAAMPGSSQKSNATMVDSNWEGNSNRGSNATLADPDWNDSIQNFYQPAGNLGGGNPFGSKKEFREEVSGLSFFLSHAGARYEVKGLLLSEEEQEETGESCLFKCTDARGTVVVSKVFYNPVNNAFKESRKDILNYMATDDGKKYTLAVFDYGTIKVRDTEYYFEMTPNVEKGDISKEPPFTFEKVVDFVKQFNEVLGNIHKHGIIHRDIKPANIYRLGDGRIVLGDFGVAKVGAVGGYSAATQTFVRTQGYTAPEITMGISRKKVYTAGSDYYSFGIALGSLIVGHFVYDSYLGSDATYQNLVISGEVPIDDNLILTEEEKRQTGNLLSGLVSFSPEHRFKYEDVEKWLKNHNYASKQESNYQEAEMKPIIIPVKGRREKYTSAKSLFFGVTQDWEHWEAGKEYLYDGLFQNHFESSNIPDVAFTAKHAVEEWRTVNEDRGLVEFLTYLYNNGPIVWCGKSFANLSEMADKILSASQPEEYGDVFVYGVISNWLYCHKEDENAAKNLELVLQIEEISKINKAVACYWFANSYASERKLVLNGKTVNTLGDLQNALFDSPKDFYIRDGLNKLINRKTGADLYGFLYSYGYKDFIDTTWDATKKKDSFNRSCQLFEMLDSIMTREGIDSSLLRNFFVQYGPLGAYTYVKNVVKSREKRIYRALNVDGMLLLDAIAVLNVPASGTIEEIMNGYLKLIQAIETMRTKLNDNPFLIQAGAYSRDEIICEDLRGVFALQIEPYGLTAPLGFGIELGINSYFDLGSAKK